MLTLIEASRLHRRFHEQYVAARQSPFKQNSAVTDTLILAYGLAFDLTFRDASICITVPDFEDIEADALANAT